MALADINAEMQRHAVMAAEMIGAEYGYEMDFSEGTIGAVEAILDNLSNDGDRSEELFSKAALLMGAYVGEVIRHAFPDATWTFPQEDTEAGMPSIKVSEIELFPLMWCYQRLQNGAAESVVARYFAFRDEINNPS